MLPLPTGEVGGGELVAMTLANLGDTGVVLTAGLHFAADRIVAVCFGQERLQLLHRHG